MVCRFKKTRINSTYSSWWMVKWCDLFSVVPPLDKNEGAIEFSLNGEYYSNVNSSKLVHQPKLET